MKADMEKLNKLVTGNSNWLEQAKTRQQNAGWLTHSQKIAVKILKTLRLKQMKQTELAQLLNVSPQQVNKIVKGSENLTLETISKIESILGVRLIMVADETPVISQQLSIQKELVYLTVYDNKAEIQPVKQIIRMYDPSYSDSFCNEPQLSYGY